MPVKILDNITVIECATFVTGPYAAALLADLGARVIKIEAAPDGDPYRYFAPDPVYSFNFAHLNRNKESLVLDLKAPEGRQICLELLKRADVFVENFRPGAAERLGIGYGALRAVNPKLVYCSISAYGQSGPRAQWKQLQRLARQARNDNELNGKLINSLLQQNREALAVLLASGDGSIYGADGRQRSPTAGKRLFGAV